MNSLPHGIVTSPHVGFLDLTPDLVENLVCSDPITDYFDVETTPFARGKFAAVRRVRCLRTGEYYAAKVVRKRRRARDVRGEALHEAAVLSLTQDSPRIVKLHKVFEAPSEMTLVLELASGGELQRVIDEEERIDERVVKKYLLQILAALRFLHQHNIAHLDLKPQNLLLTGAHPSSDVKLCDFGISRILHSNIELREVLGTPDYVAPEIIQYEPIGLATDMWSVGVLAYVLLTGHSPFGGDTKQETFLNISQCELDFPEDIFEGVSSDAMEFIKKLLIVDPSSRLSVDEAINHHWLNGSLSIHGLPISSLCQASESSSTCTVIPFQKRLGSPKHATTSNKENNKNFLNCASPPSKRECRESSEYRESSPECQSETKTKMHRSIIELCLTTPPPISSPHSQSFTTSTLSPPRTRGRVSSQIRCFEKKLKSRSKEDVRQSGLDKSEDSQAVPCSKSLSVSSLKAKFNSPVDQSENYRHITKKNNLNRSFGSIDLPDAKDKLKDNLRLSPLCLRRNEQNCDLVSPKDKKYGQRREFVDLVVSKGLIY